MTPTELARHIADSGYTVTFALKDGKKTYYVRDERAARRCVNIAIAIFAICFLIGGIVVGVTGKTVGAILPLLLIASLPFVLLHPFSATVHDLGIDGLRVEIRQSGRMNEARKLARTVSMASGRTCEVLCQSV